ncbi:MFS transporter [Massilia agilis]|uniref:MFS transporter n=1 Tax=Massilia agilis TaxID=1811226 RepID=A0ABT2D6Z5_9BURK|nr:MFS transporter [Massilia agilis]MCS0807060.1 MFS transporter [Massilia agilis]
MSRFAPRDWHPDERPMLPGSPSTPAHPPLVRVAYFLVGALLTLTGGLGNALVTANLVNLQGTLGAYATETNWLPAAFVMTNASMNLLLVKFRQQFGLRAFTELFLVLYALVTFAHLFVGELGSAIAVRAAHGMVGAALSTLGLYYTLQAFPKPVRFRGTVVSLGIAQLPLPLAYIFSSELLQFGEWHGLYVFELGLTLLALACVLALPLPPGDHYKAFRPLDFVTFALFAPGVALLCAGLTFGRVLWWTDAPWVGLALAGSLVLILAAFFVEHTRRTPLLNIRWLTNGSILRLALGMLLVRVVLAEQGVGAVNFMRQVGLNNDQLATLFTVVLLSTIAGIVVAATTTSLQHLLAPQAIALVIMALGAFIDSHATSQTRPEQMYISQGMLGFGGALFLGPLVVSLIGQVIANPGNLISFSVLFSLTQNLGGLIGTSLLGTFQVWREKYHSNVLVEQLSALDPDVIARLQAGSAAFARATTDPAARARLGLSSLAASATREANVLAYDDVFLLIALIASLHALWVFGRGAWLSYVAPPAPAAAPAAPGAKPEPEQVTD